MVMVQNFQNQDDWPCLPHFRFLAQNTPLKRHFVCLISLDAASSMSYLTPDAVIGIT